MSEQVGIRPMWNDMFLGSAVSVPEQVGIRLMFIQLSESVSPIYLETSLSTSGCESTV